MQTESQSVDQTSKVPQPQRLPHPVRITEQTWPEGTVPVVSVFNWVYNHADFIRESIDSILMQETTFPVEIIIHDDASTDGTIEIIREYEARYPQLFRNIIQTENQWSQGKSVMTPMFTAPRGEFVALTHGDDYWTSPHKLQRQTDVLAHDPSISLVGHFTDIVAEDSAPTGEPAIPAVPWPERLSLEGYLRLGYFGLQISSWLLRADALADSDWVRSLGIGDVPLMIHLASHGDIAFLPDHMSCYRRHGSSYWAANLGSWQARESIKVYSAAASFLRGTPRALARVRAFNARFQLAEMLHAEGRTVQALGVLAKLGVQQMFLTSEVAAMPPLKTIFRRMKQMSWRAGFASPRK